MNKKEHMTINQNKYLELCEKGKTRLEIADEIGVTFRTILKYQERLGVSPKREHDFDGNLKRFVKMCNDGYTRKEISEELNVTLKTVTNYINRTGVYPKSAKRKPNLDEHFFDRIDTEEKAYILGFICADGYVDSGKRNLCLNISRKDIDILYKIKRAMLCGNAITKSSTANCVRLNMSSRYLVETISKYGVVPSKTHSMTFPDIEEKMYRHFFRGYCDGDGCVHLRQVFIVIGSEYFFSGFTHYLSNLFHKDISYSYNGSYYVVVFSRKDLDIVRWMYDDSSIYLDRKYESYKQNWLSYAEKRRTTG